MLGSAASLWTDVDAALSLGEVHGVVAANDAGARWPGRLDAWVSLHADRIEGWARSRASKGLPVHHRVFVDAGAPASYPRLSGAITDFTPHQIAGQIHGGTSGLFALKVALFDLGFDRAVLCGMPMTGGAGHLRTPTAPWAGAVELWRGWQESAPAIKDRARSMSGRTRLLLGAPDCDWFTGEDRDEHRLRPRPAAA